MSHQGTMSGGGQPASDVNDLIRTLRFVYKATLHDIDRTVPDLVKAGREAEALMIERHAWSNLISTHASLSDLYQIFWQRKDMLSVARSPRLRALGGRGKLIDLHRQWDTDLCVEHFYDEWGIRAVVPELDKLGYLKPPHRSGINPVVLAEIEHMLDVLEVLIEPEWSPVGSIEDQDQGRDEKLSRHIPSEVKVEVWRRDEGKCVQCGSRERLEYDHIIPVSKGGSNTGRNIQLLCQVCNRQKAARIE